MKAKHRTQEILVGKAYVSVNYRIISKRPEPLKNVNVFFNDSYTL
jgi:hypothetical protein